MCENKEVGERKIYLVKSDLFTSAIYKLSLLVSYLSSLHLFDFLLRTSFIYKHGHLLLFQIFFCEWKIYQKEKVKEKEEKKKLFIRENVWINALSRATFFFVFQNEKKKLFEFIIKSRASNNAFFRQSSLVQLRFPLMKKRLFPLSIHKNHTLHNLIHFSLSLLSLSLSTINTRLK